MLSFGVGGVDAAPHHRACSVTFTFTTRMVEGGPTGSGKEMKLIYVSSQTFLTLIPIDNSVLRPTKGQEEREKD